MKDDAIYAFSESPDGLVAFGFEILTTDREIVSRNGRLYFIDEAPEEEIFVGTPVVSTGLSNFDLITESGTWIAPADGIYLFTLIGGGGAGGGVSTSGSTVRAGGGGGAGGIQQCKLTLALDQSIGITIGSGGNGVIGLSYGGGQTSIVLNGITYTAGGGGAGGLGRYSSSTVNCNGSGGGGGGEKDVGGRGLTTVTAGNGGGTLGGIGGTSTSGSLTATEPGGFSALGASGGTNATSVSSPGMGGISLSGVVDNYYGKGGDGVTSGSNTAGNPGNPGCVAIVY